jgi:hypothetical protein
MVLNNLEITSKFYCQQLHRSIGGVLLDELSPLSQPSSLALQIPFKTKNSRFGFVLTFIKRRHHIFLYIRIRVTTIFYWHVNIYVMKFSVIKCSRQIRSWNNLINNHYIFCNVLHNLKIYKIGNVWVEGFSKELTVPYCWWVLLTKNRFWCKKIFQTWSFAQLIS